MHLIKSKEHLAACTILQTTVHGPLSCLSYFTSNCGINIQLHVVHSLSFAFLDAEIQLLVN